jgi:hypothetical protein
MSNNAAAVAAARWRMARNRRSRVFAQALPAHLATIGKTATGLDTVATIAAASFVQDDTGQGQPWVCLVGGTVGTGTLAGDGVITDAGGVVWQHFSGYLAASPNTPA